MSDPGHRPENKRDGFLQMEWNFVIKRSLYKCDGALQQLPRIRPECVQEDVSAVML